jgi:hypothetical protein
LPYALGVFDVGSIGRAFGCPAALYHILPVPETGLKPPCPERGGFCLSPEANAIQVAAENPDRVR